MKRIVTFSLISAGVYGGVYSGIQMFQGDELVLPEVLLGTLVFFLAFFLAQMFIARKRKGQADAKHTI